MTDYKELIAKCEEWLEITNKTNCSGLHEFVSEAADAIERLQKERDAAVKDIPLLIIGNQPFTAACKICKHRFGEDPCLCFECNEITPYGNFEWRGVVNEK